MSANALSSGTPMSRMLNQHGSMRAALTVFIVVLAEGPGVMPNPCEYPAPDHVVTSATGRRRELLVQHVVRYTLRVCRTGAIGIVTLVQRHRSMRWLRRFHSASRGRRRSESRPPYAKTASREETGEPYRSFRFGRAVRSAVCALRDVRAVPALGLRGAALPTAVRLRVGWPAVMRQSRRA